LQHIAKGSNLSEVLLPATLIGVVLMSGISSLLPYITQHSLNTVNGTYLKSNQQITSAPLGQNPLLQNYKLQLEDGSTLTIKGLPASISKSIETIGVSGTTEELLASFVKLIDQLLLENKITPTEANTLKTLANKGFTLSANQRVIEEAALSCGKNKDCLKSALLNNPVILSAHAQSMLVKSTNSSKYLQHMVPLQSEANLATLKKLDPKVYDMFLGNEYVSQDPVNRAYIGKDLAAFITQYQEAEKSETLSGSVKGLTEFLATNIFSMTHMNAYQAGRAANYINKADAAKGITDPSVGSLKDVMPDDQNLLLSRQVNNMKLKPPSELIATDSKTICTLGEGQTKNLNCI
jgi:hypothetical protein